MLDLAFRHVDVFSDRALRGNGLIVVLDAGVLSADLMLAVTQEMRQFETSFVTELDLAARSAALRIFTEDEELDFAGHPVLGAAAVLHDLLDAGPDDVQWAVVVGGRSLDVRTSGRDGHVFATMDQGAATFGSPIGRELTDAYRDALGLEVGQLRSDLPMQMVSTGLPYLIVPVTPEGLERVRIVHPDFESLLAESGAKFAYVLDPDRPEGRTWDNAGRVEDIATGSAAGPAIGYLVEHGRLPRGEPLLMHQGRYLGRPSTIEVRVEASGRVWVGGPVAPVAEGRFSANPR